MVALVLWWEEEAELELVVALVLWWEEVLELELVVALALWWEAALELESVVSQDFLWVGPSEACTRVADWPTARKFRTQSNRCKLRLLC